MKKLVCILSLLLCIGQEAFSQCGNFSGLAANYCTTSPPSTLVPVTGGGTFLGPGITGNVFNPATAGAGTFTIIYNIAVPGCTTTTSQSTTVTATPVVNAGPDLTICAGQTTTLQGSGSGGTSYSWSPTNDLNNPGIFMPLANPTVTTVYTLTGSIPGGGGAGGIVPVATPTIVLQGGPGCTQMGVAYNPNQNLYYSCGGGYTGCEVVTYSAAGAQLLFTNNSGHDWRGIWWNPNTNSLEGNACSGCGAVGAYRVQNLNGSGYAIAGGTAYFSPNQPDFQSMGAYDPTNNQVIYYYSGVIYRVNHATGVSAGTVNITGLPVGFGNLSVNIIGYTGIVGSEYMVYDYVLERVYYINRVTGAYSGMTQLPGAAPNIGSYYYAGFSNGQIWIWNGSGYNGYRLYNGQAVCSSSDAMTLNVNPSPDATFTGLTPNMCTGAGAVTLTPNQGGGTFSGTGVVGNTFDPNVAGAGTFTITYTITAGGCSASSSQTVTITTGPTVDAGPDVTICNGQSTTLNGTAAGAMSYEWSPAAGLNNPFILNPVATPTVTTTYTLTAFTAAGGGGGIIGNASHTIDLIGSPGCTPMGTAYNPNFDLYYSCGGGSNTCDIVTYDGAGNQVYYQTNGDHDWRGIWWNPNTGTLEGNSCAGCPTSSLYKVQDLDGSGNAINTGTGYFSPNQPDFQSMGAYDYDNDEVIFYNGGIISRVDHATNTNLPDVNISGIPGGFGNLSYYVVGYSGVAGYEYMVYDDANQAVYFIDRATGNYTGTSQLPPGAPSVGQYYYVGFSNGQVWLFNGNGYSGYAVWNPITGCTATDSMTITIAPAPDVSFTGLGGPYCTNDAPVTLTPVTPGGVFSGAGIVGNTFDPSISGAGTFVITYTLTNPCPNAGTQTVVVNNGPNAVFLGLNPTYCVNAAPSTMTPFTGGGTFSGPGVSGNTFDPSVAGIGTHTITYTVTTGSCTATTSQTVNVTASPNGTFTGLVSPMCESDPAVTLTPATPGGTFSGPGIVGNTFDPAVAGVGTQIITYTVTTGGCTATSSQTVVVNAMPNATFIGLNPTYCVNAGTSTLAAVTGGGTFTGPGISGNIFDPAVAGVGTHTITYTVTTGACTATSSQTVQVGPAPNANFSGLVSPYCESDPAVTLVPATPGGTFTGSGITGNTFDPAVAGAGSHTITYTITTGGCTSTTSQIVTVTGQANATFIGLLGPYCTNNGTVILTPLMGGGTFSGPGVSGSTFSPSVAGVGTHTITYTVGAGNCVATTSQTVTVNATPNATFTGLPPSICQGASPITLIPVQGGGSFTGSGVIGNTFDPSITGPGTFTVTYTITTGGCTSVTNQNIIVNATPATSISGLANDYCIDEPSVVLTGTPAGGTFSGAGISGSNFNPATAGAGLHTIMYSYTNASGCTGTSTFVTEVHALPVVTFTLQEDTVCQNEGLIALPGGSPSGGVYSGTGVAASTFDPAVAGLGMHTITYTYTDLFGCTSSATDDVFVTTCVGINDQLFTQGWDVFPNPASEFITLKWNGSFLEDAGIRITDMLGRDVIELNSVSFDSGMEKRIETSQLSSGTYTIKVKSSMGWAFLKFVKE